MATVVSDKAAPTLILVLQLVLTASIAGTAIGT
jgi:hypothetical protein